MFEKLFKQHRTLYRHREGPLAPERESYLEHRAKEGAAPGTLVRIARELLVVTRELDLSSGIPIAPEQVKVAADRWAHRQRRRRRCHKLHWSRDLLLQVATDWLRFIGRFRKPEVKPLPFATLMEDFATFMDRERGLSAATIRNYRWQIQQFLHSFSARSRPFTKVSVADVDAFLAQKAKRWCRVSATEWRLAYAFALNPVALAQSLDFCTRASWLSSRAMFLTGTWWPSTMVAGDSSAKRGRG